MSEDKDWVVNAARHMFNLVRVYEDTPKQASDAKGINHALWLLWQVREEDEEGTKAHRYLAHAYCILIYEGRISIEVARNMNRMALDGELPNE